MLLIMSSIVILLLILMMVLIYLFYVGKKTQLLVSQKEKEAQFEQELALAQIEMREMTLTYVGQELHDDIGQKLSVAKMMNNQMISKTEGETKDNLKEINDLLGESIQDIRNMSKTFISEQIEHFGLIDSLELEVKRISKLNLIETEFCTNKNDIDINPKDGLIIFRIIQESINNALKHSKAKKLVITVSDEPNILLVNVADNGVGISENAVKSSGLANMKKRATMIKADLNINSEKNVGTSLQLIYPKS